MKSNNAVWMVSTCVNPQRKLRAPLSIINPFQWETVDTTFETHKPGLPISSPGESPIPPKFNSPIGLVRWPCGPFGLIMGVTKERTVKVPHLKRTGNKAGYKARETLPRILEECNIQNNINNCSQQCPYLGQNCVSVHVTCVFHIKDSSAIMSGWKQKGPESQIMCQKFT